MYNALFDLLDGYFTQSANRHDLDQKLCEFLGHSDLSSEFKLLYIEEPFKYLPFIPCRNLNEKPSYRKSFRSHIATEDEKKMDSVILSAAELPTRKPSGLRSQKPASRPVVPPVPVPPSASSANYYGGYSTVAPAPSPPVIFLPQSTYQPQLAPFMPVLHVGGLLPVGFPFSGIPSTLVSPIPAYPRAIPPHYPNFVYPQAYAYRQDYYPHRWP